MAYKLHTLGQKVVGIPKTIDRDLNGTDYTLGYDTALNVITEEVDRLRTTAGSHSRLFVVEVMGRHAGWLALEGGEDGLLAHHLAVARVVAAAGPGLLPRERPGEPDGADRFRGRAPPGAGDAADGDAHPGVAAGERALGHLPDHLLAHRAVAVEGVGADPEQLALGGVGIGDEAPVEPDGAPGDGGDDVRDSAARAGFRRHEAQTAVFELTTHPGRQPVCDVHRLRAFQRPTRSRPVPPVSLTARPPGLLVHKTN